MKFLAGGGMAIGAGAVLSACSCPAMQCGHGLFVSIDRLEEPGFYEVAAIGDATASCQFELDEDGAVVEDDSGDACFQPPDSPNLSLRVAKGEYEVVLSDEGGELASAQVSRRDWTSSYPFGRECGRCDVASVTLEL